VRLLEEPQAAFYSWLEDNEAARPIWQGAEDGDLRPRHVLVVDISGGTSDFSLFELGPSAGGPIPDISRVAVSDHTLLGGDNIDLALAHLAESSLPGGRGQVSGAQWDRLVSACRDLKETALSREGVADERFVVALAGRDDRSNRRSREPACCNGLRSRIRVWDWIADPIWASGHGAASTGRTHDRNRPTRRASHFSSCIQGAVHTCNKAERGETVTSREPSPASAEGTVTFAGDLTVKRLGFGAMRITGPGIWGEPRDRDAAIKLLRRVVERGVNFIDTADSYGPEVSEELIAEALPKRFTLIPQRW